MAQQALFDGGVVPEAVERRRTSQRPGATPAPHARTVGDPIEVAASQVVGELDPLARARAAIALRDLAAEVFASSIRDASEAGKTWREIGAALDMPFQTLHRRYGEKY